MTGEAKAEAAGFDPDAYLAENDSYRFFDRIGGLLRTGPTGTNVCDLQLVLRPLDGALRLFDFGQALALLPL